MTSTYRAAVIGCGKAPTPGEQAGKLQGGFRIGYEHARGMSRVPRLQLIAAVDINADNLKAFQDAFHVEHGYDDTRRMLREAKPDVVSICTYVGLHFPMIRACAEAGVKGVLCEKPFVASPKELQQVRELAAQSGMKISIAHQRTAHPGVARARELYNNGSLGQRLAFLYGVQDWDMSEMGSHWVDMARFLHNDDPIDWVMCQARVRQTRGFGHAMEDHALATFSFQHGGRAILDAGRPLTGPWTELLLGSEGMIGMMHNCVLHVYDKQGYRVEDFSQFGWETLYPAAFNDLIDWFQGGPVPVLGLPRTGVTAEAIFAAYASAIRGDRVDLPLDQDAAFWTMDRWPIEYLADQQR